MDNNFKRMVLAVVICAGILLAYQHFNPKSNTEKQQQSAQTTQVAPPMPSTGQAATVPQTYRPLDPGQSAPQASEMTARDITVDTPLFTAVFSERGGGLRSFTLKDHTFKLNGNEGFPLLDLAIDQPSSLSLALINLDPMLSQRVFASNVSELKLDDRTRTATLEFSYEHNGVMVHRVYEFSANSYVINHKVFVTNHTGHQVETVPELTMVQSTKFADDRVYTINGMTTMVDKNFHEFSLSNLEDNPVESGKVNWVALNIPYFLTLVAPDSQTDLKRSVRGSITPPLMSTTLIEPHLSIADGQRVGFEFLIFFGPKDVDLLEPLGKNLIAAVDFGWFDAIAKPLLSLLKFLYRYIGNYGVCIILVTIIVKLLFWPLTRSSYRSMKNMQRLQPQVNKLREKYKNDRSKLNQETMKLYKSHKVNPMGGCLPIIIQIPVFFAFYKVLGSAIELRHAPFMLWITDLSAPDRLPIGGMELPWVGAGLPVLTLLMGISMFIQQKMMPAGGDPTQRKIMMFLPVVFTIMFVNFPSGLVLYWFCNNLLSILQQYLTLRSNKI